MIRTAANNSAGTLLVVDDNPVVLAALTEFLRGSGFTVVESRTGTEALPLARSHAPDLILLDVLLPDLNGLELCRRIKADRALQSSFVVLLSSSEISSGSQINGLDSGADGYITRPITNRELLARLQSILRIQKAEAALRRAHDELEERVAERTAELAQANTALRAMSRRLLEVQEKERRFLARELHDEAGQLLTGLKLVLDRAMMQTSPGREALAEALGLVNLLMERMRSLSLELRPAVLDDLGLLVALEWQFKRYLKQTGIQVQFRHTPLPHRLPSLVETAIFRIGQEALTNVARHAQVREISVRLWRDAERVGLQVEDKGVGFDPQAALAARSSSGLAGMRERAELLGGEFTIESRPDKGTLVTVEIPVPTNLTGSPGEEPAP